MPWVDHARIALFGSSFSGGHVVTVASGDVLIAAAIAQAPFADGLAQLKITPPKTAARATFDGLRDTLGAALGRPPVLIPAAGPPGTYAVMTAPEAEPGFRAIVGEGSRWRNEVAARVMLWVGLWRPVKDARASPVRCSSASATATQTTPPDGRRSDGAERAAR